MIEEGVEDVDGQRRFIREGVENGPQFPVVRIRPVLHYSPGRLGARPPLQLVRSEIVQHAGRIRHTFVEDDQGDVYAHRRAVGAVRRAGHGDAPMSQRAHHEDGHAERALHVALLAI